MGRGAVNLCLLSVSVMIEQRYRVGVVCFLLLDRGRLVRQIRGRMNRLFEDLDS